jgi:hypothetical protein
VRRVAERDVRVAASRKPGARIPPKARGADHYRMASLTPRRLTALLVVSASLVLAHGAAAQNYCVADPTCSGTPVGDLQNALNMAAAWSDTDSIHLGPGTFVAPPGGFKYTPAASPVEIAGAGAGKTKLTAAPGNTKATLTVRGGGASIRNLTVEVPASVPVGYVGLDTDAWVEHIAVTESSPQANGHTGVRVETYGWLRDSVVKIGDDAPGNTGVDLNGDAVLLKSTVSGRTGITTGSLGTTATIARSRVSGQTGIAAYAGTTNISQTIVRYTDWDGNGIAVATQPSADTIANVDGVVVIGPGNGSNGAIGAGTALFPSRSVDVNVVNSVVRGAPVPFALGAAGPGHGKLSVSYSDFDPAGDDVYGAAATVALAHNLNTGSAAGFEDAAVGDYHLRAGSPLVDAGDPASAAGDPAPAIGDGDLDGSPLNTDGDGDGVARRDIGVFETPGVPLPAAPDPAASSRVSSEVPVPPAISARDTKAPVLSRLARVKARLRYRLSEAASVRIRIERQVVKAGHKRWRTVQTLVRSSRAGRNSIRIKALAGAHGRYRALARATDAAGNRSAVRRLEFRSR